MKFTFSKCVAIRVPDLHRGKAFYTDVMGMKEDELPDGYELTPGEGNPYLMESDSLTGPVLEFIVEDVEAARNHLVKHGCTVLTWKGAGGDCYIKDPNGVVFNLWEKS